MDSDNNKAGDLERKRKIEDSGNDAEKTSFQSKNPKISKDTSQPDRTNESDPLLSINDAKLREIIGKLDSKFDETISKEDQLRTLEILVKTEKKLKEYEQFLSEENSVPNTIDPNDVSKISEAETYRRLCLQVRKFVKFSLQNWEENTDERFSLALLTETKRDLVKLMYKLRSGKIQLNLLISLVTIVHDIQIESFNKANEDYMKLSIGNVAWPIGVRDVGIHARSADSKITGDDKNTVANIMQNEHIRRWIISVKRIINWWEHCWRKQKK